jgi:hypothetical protein
MDWTPDNWEAAQDAALNRGGRVSVTRYRTDAIVNRNWNGKAPDPFLENKRGEIGSEPSSKSLKNLVFLLNNSDVIFDRMVTLTLCPEANDLPVESHKNALRASLERLRRWKVSQYCWVREFQASGSVHWHIFTSGGKFTDLPSGAIDKEASRDWSKWWAGVYRKMGVPDCSGLRFMADGDGKGFLGSVRVERLRSDAGGRYAGKEGAKRFQKVPPEKWQLNGGAWWRGSRGITCTPIETTVIDAVELKAATVTINGEPKEIAYRMQYGLGVKLENSS